MDKNIETDFEDRSASFKERAKERLGAAGRSLKKIDLRKQIVAYPFAAVGIAAAAGAIVGLVRPTPQKGRISSALISTLGLIGFRLVREAAVRELGQAAKNYVLNKREGQEGFAGQTTESRGVRYSPSV